MDMTHNCLVEYINTDGDVVHAMIVECADDATQASAHKHFMEFGNIFIRDSRVADVRCTIKPKGGFDDELPR